MNVLQDIVFLFSLYVLFGIFERFFPVQKKQPLLEGLRNLLFGIMYLAIGGVATFLLLKLLPVRSPSSSSHDPVFYAAIVLLALFVWDFVFYWYHRAEHRFAWLWTMHSFHHSDAHLNTLSSLRHSWLEHPIQTLLITVPVSYLLRFDVTTAVLFNIVISLWLFFVHANLRLHLGAVGEVIGGPQVHRIHHSLLEQHRDKNFAVYFPFIDKLFGTYYAPAPNEFPATGTGSLPTNLAWHEGLTRPFASWITKKKK